MFVFFLEGGIIEVLSLPGNIKFENTDIIIIIIPYLLNRFLALETKA